MTKLIINSSKKQSKINKEIYGHFSEHLGRCIYEGIYVGEDSQIPNKNGMRTDVVEALKHIRIPVLRWPGGCFADEYHWKDGIGPKETRKKMINTHWGGVVEDNSFGTHEFFELCEQLGCEAYVNGNLGSGTVQEMSEWVEYITFEGVSPMADLRKKNGHEKPWKLDFFGVGNENWGCGGNMNPDFYANEYRRYQTYVRNYHPDHPIHKVCCGANVDDYRWTETLMKNIPRGMMQGISLHNYTFTDSWTNKGNALGFNEDQYFKVLENGLRKYNILSLPRHTSFLFKNIQTPLNVALRLPGRSVTFHCVIFLIFFLKYLYNHIIHIRIGSKNDYPPRPRLLLCLSRTYTYPSIKKQACGGV